MILYIGQIIVVCHIFMDMKESDVKIKCFSIFHFYGSNKIIFDNLHKSKLIIRYENLKKIVCIFIYNFILFFFFVLKSTEYIHSMNVNQINPFGFVPSCFGGLAINLLAYLSAFKC